MCFNCFSYGTLYLSSSACFICLAAASSCTMGDPSHRDAWTSGELEEILKLCKPCCTCGTMQCDIDSLSQAASGIQNQSTPYIYIDIIYIHKHTALEASRSFPTAGGLHQIECKVLEVSGSQPKRIHRFPRQVVRCQETAEESMYRKWK